MTRTRWHLLISGLVVATLAAAAWSEREPSAGDDWRAFLQALMAPA